MNSNNWPVGGKISLLVLRIATGWLMFYAGITKILNPEWSAAGYLNNAKTFSGFFQWFAQPDILPVINLVNEWGLTLLGVSLVLGIFVRLGSILGAALMLLYYFPVLEFPYIPGAHAFIIDEHIIYFFVLILFAAVRAGRAFGLDEKLLEFGFWDKIPTLRNWMG